MSEAKCVCTDGYTGPDCSVSPEVYVTEDPYVQETRPPVPEREEQPCNRCYSGPSCDQCILHCLIRSHFKISHFQIKTVVRDARIVVERGMAIVHYAIRMIVRRGKSANVRMDIEAETATIRPTRDCVVM